MKEKSVWKEIVNRGKWVIIFLVALLFSQLPLALSYYLTSRRFPLLQSGLLVSALSLLVLLVFIIGARKSQLTSFSLSFFKTKDLARLALSYLVILSFNILGVL